MRASRLAVLLVALALAGSARQAGGFIDCCYSKSSPAWLAGWRFRLPSQEAADRTLGRLGFVWTETPSQEGNVREVVIGCSTLSWLPVTGDSVLGMSAGMGGPRFRNSIYCADHPAPPPPFRRAESSHPNGAVELIREAELDYGGSLRVIETGPGDPLSAGASGWLGFTVRVRDLEATARVLEDRGVWFSRVDAEDGPLLRVAPADGGGVMVEFVGER